MKRIIKTFLLILLIIPVCINASTYGDSKIKAKRYLMNNHADTYQRYLVDADKRNIIWSLNASDNSSYVNGGDLAYGGLLDKTEYESSIAEGDTRSYLFDGQAFWTMTSSGSGNHYVVNSGSTSDSSTKPSTKVTEYVLHDTYVTGKGTQNDPWKFKAKYRFLLTAENGTVEAVNANLDNSGGVIINVAGGSAEYILHPNSGMNYIYNTCGLVTEPSDIQEINNNNRITFKGINRDISCKVVFGKGLFELTIDEPKVEVSPVNKLYVRNSEQFYSDEDGKFPIQKLTLVNNYRGYNLNGFNYAINGETTKVIDKDGNIIRSSAKKITENSKLSAIWEAKKINITLNGNGGLINGNSTTTAIVTFDEEYGIFTTPTKKGYDFTGWFTQASGGDQVKPNDKVDIVSPITLYAHWTPHTYTVSFNCNGGSGEPALQYGKYDSNFTLTSNKCIRGGFVQNGWKDQSNVSWTTSNRNNWKWVDITYDPVLYAQWTACSNNANVKDWNTGSDCSIKSCNTGYRISNNSCIKNKVTIKYKVYSGETLTSGNGYSTNSDGYITKSGSVFTTTAYYGETIGSNGLANYNNASYIEIKKSNYVGVSGKEWVNINDSSKQYNQATEYQASDFCNAGSNDCEVTVRVNWVFAGCSAGYYNDNGTCKKCPANSYSSAGASSCTSCPSGYTSPAGSTSSSACKKPVAQAPLNCLYSPTVNRYFLITSCTTISGGIGLWNATAYSDSNCTQALGFDYNIVVGSGLSRSQCPSHNTWYSPTGLCNGHYYLKTACTNALACGGGVEIKVEHKCVLFNGEKFDIGSFCYDQATLANINAQYRQILNGGTLVSCD